ncbi:MAG: DUF885 domain-containing protein [Maricaulaceae bacterium]|nr:DUF885 domain-containing protein [Maricaulaceae bacterium]
MRFRHLLAGACALAITGAPAWTPALAQPAAETAAEQTETQRLYAWFQQVFLEDLELNPITKTYLGMYDDLEALGSWGRVDDAFQVEQFERGQRLLAHMRATFDFDSLDLAGQASYRLFEHLRSVEASNFPLRDQSYTFNPLFPPHTMAATFLMNFHRISAPAHAEAYVRRIAGVGPLMDEVILQSDERAANGVMLPRFAYAGLISSARNLIAGAPFDDSGEDNAILADFRGKVTALNLPEDEAAALIASAEAALTDAFGPAIRRLIDTLERQEAMADDRDGVWKLPRGEEYYAAQLYNFTTRHDLDAETIHNMGLREIERIHGEMREIMTRVGFEGTLQDFFEFMRTDEQFYHPDTPEGRQAYIDQVQVVTDRMYAALPEYFGVLPQAGLEVREVEAFRAATSPTAFYQGPPPGSGRPGIYYANTANMRNLPIYSLETLAYHEGVPGHHLQLAITSELDAPMFQRMSGISAYSEGWGLYAERLGKDMGFFEDPYQDFGRLSYELWRAGRLVVDTGAHHLRWTRQDMIDFLMQNTSFTEEEIVREVERYIVWPGQAVSYMTGMLTILELRDRAMQALGDDFDWGEFHDVVLTAGAVPMPFLIERVDGYIARTLANR